MALANRHTFQILTKRPERMLDWFRGPGGAWARERLPNVWLGTSIENDRWMGRADYLRQAPAAVRFISAEPLLGPLPSLDLAGIDWLIVGGESGGPDERRLTEDKAWWVRDLCDRAQATRTAFFFKQWGGATAKSRGRVLAGRTWDEIPARPVAQSGTTNRSRVPAL